MDVGSNFHDVWVGFDGIDQSAVTWAFLKLASKSPDNMQKTLVAARGFSEELYQQTIAATYFAKGNIEKATGIYKSLADSSLNRLNFLSLARCYNAVRNHSETASILEKGFQYWNYDHEYVLEAASAQFRIGNTQKANEYLKLIASHLAQDRAETEPLANELNIAVRTNQMARSEDRDIYDEAFVRRLWQTYLDEQQTYTPTQSNTSYRLTALENHISDCIRSNPSVETVIDFGVMNGLVLHKLSGQFPAINFLGCDRQKLVKELNSSNYIRKNLSFIDGDILEIFRDPDLNRKKKLLYHCFTSVFMYPEFLRTLYRTCAESGVKHICLFEPCSFNHHALKFERFDEMSEISQPMRGHLILHNYPRLLREAGYDIVSIDYSFSSLLTPPIKLVGDNNACIVAELR